jgi:hypothetical protein
MWTFTIESLQKQLKQNEINCRKVNAKSCIITDALEKYITIVMNMKKLVKQAFWYHFQFLIY